VVVVIVVLAIVLGLPAFIWWSQERILFQPPRSFGNAVQAGRVHYTASDGQHLVGYLVGEHAGVTGVLLCFHGNADLAMWQLDWAQSVNDRTGYTVMLAEYRGYMSVEGTPTYETAKLDAVAAYEYVRSELGVGDGKLAYFGHSLGSAVATELAELHKPRALLLQSPFTSALAMATLILTAPLAFVWKLVSRIHFDTAQAVARLDIPVAVAHGKRDRIVPFRMGMAVYDAAKIKGPLLVVNDAGHNDIPRLAGDRYWQWVAMALSSVTET
jgi:fermentation-respiration switch protein FrsA (DUF1100 family)